MVLTFVPLAEFIGTEQWRNRLKEFTSGNERWDVELAEYLGHGLAARDQRERLAVTHLTFDDHGNLVGYVTVAWTGVRRTDDDSIKFRYPSLPGLLLARFAVSASYQRRGYGNILMEWVHAFAQAALAPCRFIALDVDRENTAADFYRHHGFRVFEDNPDSRTIFMAKDMLNVSPHG